MRVGERLVPLEGAKLRALLVLLLLHANEVVPSDRLIDDLWSGSPPSTAPNALQVYVSHLRKLLGREALLTRPPGYLLRVEPDQVDAVRCERLIEQAREALADGRPEEALATLEEALSLRQGTPLADFVYESFAQAEINRLEELHQAALEDRFEAHLALGRGADLVGELETLVAEHPLRERLRGHLMLALYRAGRQAEALELYQNTRRLLVEELGIEPSPSLQRLETAILRQDPSLEPPELRPAAEPTPSPPREVRKTVTVLFLDVASEGGRLDAEPLLRVTTQALATATGVLEGHGGSVTELPASTLMAVFGVPAVHEDDPLRAVRAAAEFRGALQDLNEEMEQEWGVRLLMRAGVETGEVVAGASVAGEAIDAAARLKQAARQGEILVGEGTRELLRRIASFEPSGSAFRLFDVAPGASLIARRETPMVGRARELAQLGQAFEHVGSERTPALFTLLGPAGIGKSRLAAEFGALVEGQATVLQGRCLPYGKGITFWPLAETVRQAAGATTPEAIAALLPDYEEAELIASRVAAAVGRPDAEAASDETFWAIRKLLQALARDLPLLLVFDDIHWAESTFLDLVESVVDLSRETPILLFCLARPELLEERPSWGGGKVNATAMLLEALSGAESEALIAHVLGDRDLAPDTRARVAEAAEGNPLFLEQMLAMLAERGGLADERVLPPTIHALLAARLDRLDPDERSVIERAAVVGKEFSQDALAALADDGEEATSLTRDLEKLIRRDFIRPESSTSARGEGFRFRHNLIRDAAYAAIPKRVRAVLHERFATWLGEGSDPRPGEQEEIVGYHFEQAYLHLAELGPVDERARGLAERAAEHLAVVGERAYGRGDGPAAANLLSRAVSLLPAESPERLDLLVDLGDALRESGEFKQAEYVLGEAIERAEASGEQSLEARAFVVRLRLRMQTESDFAAPTLLEATDRAIEVLERVGDERGLAKAWSVRAWFPWLQCNASAAEKALLRASEYAGRAGDERAEAYSLNLLLGAGLFGPTRVSDAIRRCEELLALPPRQQRVKASAYRALAGLVAMEGRFGEARELLEQDRAIIEDVGLRVAAAVASEIWGIVEMLAGDPEAAERRLREGYGILDAMGEKSGLSTLAAMLAHAVYAQGRHEEAFRFTEISEEAAPEEDRSANVYWLAARAKVLARRGRSEEGETHARKALELAEPTDFLNMRGHALTDFAEVLRLAGRASEACTAVAEALQLYEQKGNTVAAQEARAVQAELASPALLS
ncbi:MAG: BTAD domain-containing putative transcriptional regulator [Gaiellaceae bacterium]